VAQSANTFHLPYMLFVEFYFECVLQKFVCVYIILVLIGSLKPILYMKLKLHFSFSKIQKNCHNLCLNYSH